MKMISEQLAAVTLGEPVVFRNLSMTPLLETAGIQPDYLTLDEALAMGAAKVTEVSGAGSVPDLRFENQGDLAVLLVDGEELVGAKQNRILNLSVLAPARTAITIPVSCVEAGRWSHVSPEFRSEERTYYAAGRARKAAQVTESLRESGSRRSRQGEVWNDIAMKAERLGSLSPTSAMASMYVDHGATLDQFVTGIPTAAGQAGAVFAINGQVRGLELFDFAETFRKLAPKLVRSYALDAIDEENSAAPVMASAVADLLQNCQRADAAVFPSLGEGEDVRLTGHGLAGGALVARDRVIHLCAFRVAESDPQRRGDATGRLARASQRRRHFGGRQSGG